MATSTVENYLKTLYAMQQACRQPVELISVGRLAEMLGVTPGTATSMVKRLDAQGLLCYTARRGVRLSDTGERKALAVLRRHRLVELFLVEVMHMDWAEVHDDAEVLEHAISDRMLDRMDAMLGYPTEDPHGHPIPDADGRMRVTRVATLAEHGPGRTRVDRIDDTDPAFLRFVAERGLGPGALVEIQCHDAVTDTVTVRPEGGAAVQLGSAAAARIRVRLAEGPV